MTLDIDSIEQRANAATGGPWHWVDPETDLPVPDLGGESQIFRGSLRTTREWPTASVGLMPEFVLFSVDYEQASSADAKFIAAARTDIPDLIAEVQQLRADKARLEREIADLHRHGAASRKSICELSDRYKAERDAAVTELRTVRALLA